MKKATTEKTNKLRPARGFFDKTKEGRTTYKGLVHKDTGRPFDDIDYLELIGRKAIEMDKLNNNPNLPTNYGSYDRDTCLVGKEVCKAIDEKMPRQQILEYINTCIDLEK